MISHYNVSSPYSFKDEDAEKIEIYLQEFIDSYKESLGLEGAKELIFDATRQLNLSDREVLTKQEALKICEVLRKQPGFVCIVAGILANRMKLR